MLKKISIVFLSVLLVLNASTVIFAHDLEVPTKNEILDLSHWQERELVSIPVGEAKYIDDGTGKLVKISDLLSFETEEEANEFSETIKLELNKPIQFDHITQIAPMSTNGDVLVANKNISIAGSINLRVAYGTSGNNNTGYITYHDAYTTFTGLTLGFGWTEDQCNSQITSSGKDIYAYTSGTLDYYLLVNGVIKLYSQPVTLSGYAYVIR